MVSLMPEGESEANFLNWAVTLDETWEILYDPAISGMEALWVAKAKKILLSKIYLKGSCVSVMR